MRRECGQNSPSVTARPIRLLLTRPARDAAALAFRIAKAGHQTLIEPLLTITPYQPLPLPPAADIQALLATSANSMRILHDDKALPALRLRPLLAIGSATAQAAQEAGFIDIHAAAGDITALAALARRCCRRDGGLLVHVAGDVIAGDLRAELAADGFAIERYILYRALARTSLSMVTQIALRNAMIEGVLLYSPRSAAIFTDLVARADLQQSARRPAYYCLSPAVAKIVTQNFGKVQCHIAATPSEASLLELIAPPSPSP